MLIKNVETFILKKTVDNTFGGSIHNYNVGGHLVTRITTDDGKQGWATSYFGLIESGMATVKMIIDRELTPILLGKDPHFVRQIRAEMHSKVEYYGVVGVATIAISAIDICLWDLIGKDADLPTALVLGARRRSVPAYAMVGWYFNGGIKELVQHCVNAAEEGFKAVKIKIGRGDLSDDINRISAVRKELGDDFTLMVDANCAFDEMEALRRGYAFQDLNIFWFEEPLPQQFLEGYSRLRNRLSIPIAAGENCFTRYQFWQLIRNNCVDIVQPDNRRAGGVTEWMDIASISEAAGLKFASHLGGPGNVNVMCAVENVIYLECEGIKHDNEMLEHPLEMKDGEVQLPNVPGMGNEIKQDYIDKYIVR